MLHKKKLNFRRPKTEQCSQAQDSESYVVEQYRIIANGKLLQNSMRNKVFIIEGQSLFEKEKNM